MNQIGNIIKELRESANITRVQLCNGICTDKYLYMIEKGQRTPSVEILKLFSDRLHCNLFEFCEYLSYPDPLRTRAMIERLNECRYKSDMPGLREAVERARKMAAFKREPLKYYLETNSLIEKILCQRSFAQGVESAEHLLSKIPDRYIAEPFVVELHILLSGCHQILGSWEKAQEAIEQADARFHQCYSFAARVEIFISLMINKQQISCRMQKHRQSLETGLRLYEYQQQQQRYRRIDITCLYNAYACYHLADTDAAMQWFKRGLYAALLSGSDSIYTQTLNEDFWALMQQDAMPADLKKEIMDTYHLQHS